MGLQDVVFPPEKMQLYAMLIRIVVTNHQSLGYSTYSQVNPRWIKLRSCIVFETAFSQAISYIYLADMLHLACVELMGFDKRRITEHLAESIALIAQLHDFRRHLCLQSSPEWWD